jgi:hypothetical protein
MVLLAFGCATGVTDETGFVGLSTAGGGGMAGAGGEFVASTVSAASTTSAGAGGEGGSPPACEYDPINTCSMGTQLPAIAGDESGPIITEMGSTSEWFVIHIEEKVSSISDADMSYTVTLQSPPGMDYDLFVHPGPQDGNPDCNASPLVGDHMNATETVSQGWDDDQGIGGEDDSVWLSIEVRYISGAECGPDAQWTLTVEGDT